MSRVRCLALSIVAACAMPTTELDPAAGPVTVQSRSLQGGYPVLDKKVVPSLGVSYAWYRFSPDSRANVAVALLAGAVVRPTNTFSFDLQGQWMTNKILTHDFRLQARISYWFAERLSVLAQEAP